MLLGAWREAPSSALSGSQEKLVLDGFLEEASQGSLSGANSNLKPRSAMLFPTVRGHPSRRSPPLAMCDATTDHVALYSIPSAQVAPSKSLG